MKEFYHFTARCFIPGIMDDGISRGAIPCLLSHSVVNGLVRGVQWLTTNPQFLQEWCNPEYSTLPYDRSEVRLLIELPDDAPVKPWLDYAEENPRLKISKKILGEFGDPENWWIYSGTIPAYAIKVADYKNIPINQKEPTK